jgi:hypothetical protein
MVARATFSFDPRVILMSTSFPTSFKKPSTKNNPATPKLMRHVSLIFAFI